LNDYPDRGRGYPYYLYYPALIYRRVYLYCGAVTPIVD
jgi:hypothetical protein